MKVSKRQLKRIIKEEKRKLVFEGDDRELWTDNELKPGWDDVSPDDIVDGYYNAINQLIWDDWAAAGIDPKENDEEVLYAIQALKNLINNFESGQF